jgi:hypothetical protein
VAKQKPRESVSVGEMMRGRPMIHYEEGDSVAPGAGGGEQVKMAAPDPSGDQHDSEREFNEDDDMDVMCPSDDGEWYDDAGDDDEYGDEEYEAEDDDDEDEPADDDDDGDDAGDDDESNGDDDENDEDVNMADMDLEMEPEYWPGAESYRDMPRVVEGEQVGVTRVYFDAENNVLGSENLDEGFDDTDESDDGDGEIDEMAAGQRVRFKGPKQQKAVFAKAFAKSARKKGGKAKQAADVAHRTKNVKYYRKFRGKYAGKRGLNKGKAIKAGKRVKGESVEEGQMDEKLGRGLAGRARKAQQAMFAKAFARTPRSKSTGKPKADHRTASAARRTPKGKMYYREFRGKYGKRYKLKQKPIINKMVRAKNAPGPARRMRKRNESQIIMATAKLLESNLVNDILDAVQVIMQEGAEWSPQGAAMIRRSIQGLGSQVDESEDGGLLEIIYGAAAHLDAVFGESADGVDEDEDENADEGDEIDEEAVAALQQENEKLHDLVDTLYALNQATVVEAKVTEVCLKHPILEKVRDKLAQCESEKDVVTEANTYIGLIHGGATGVRAPANGNGGTRVHAGVVSGKTQDMDGVPRAPLNENNAGPIVGSGDSSADSCSARVADHRRRQRAGSA